MRRALLSVAVLAALALPAAADHPGAATRADIRQLQTEMELLDDSLRQVDADHPRSREFRRREQQLRDALTQMSDEVRRHQSQASAWGPSKDEISQLRRDTLALRNDIEQSLGSQRPRVGRDISLPDGTEIQVRLDQSLTSRTARQEDRFAATVAQSVMQDGVAAVPVGTEVQGTIVRAEAAERPSRGGRLELAFDSLRFDDGRRVDIDARVVSLEEEGIDKSKAGLGALIGGILGAVVDGKQGAVIGGILGGGGTVVASTGDDVELPAGTVLTLRLDRPAVVARR
jgi:hypothetical protein